MRFLLASVLTLLSTLIPAFGQTGLYSYDGGYFLRNGSHWEEYRPAGRHEVWNEYEQVKTNRRILDSLVCARRCLCRGMDKQADNNITCTVDGPACLLGLEGADNTDTGDYRDNRQRVYNGRLLAYIRTTGDAGEINVT